MSDKKELLDKVIDIAKLAGDAIMDVYESDDFDVETKHDDNFTSPLTRADKAAHNVIVTELGKISDYYVLSEEGESHIPDTNPYWLVDPLDGTKEFVKRNGEFTVNIALVIGDRPVLGVVYAPALDVYYCGDVESGVAYKIVKGERIDIKAESRSNIPKIVVSRSHKDEKTQKLLDAIGEHEEVAMGSSLKLCLVAEGEAALYPRLGPTSLCDTGAADAVVTAAGGKVTQLNGKELSYKPDQEILNPNFVVSAINSPVWQEHLA